MSVRGNFRRGGDAAAQGRYDDMVPLLFEIRLSDALNARVGVSAKITPSD